MISFLTGVYVGGYIVETAMSIFAGTIKKRAMLNGIRWPWNIGLLVIAIFKKK